MSTSRRVEVSELINVREFLAKWDNKVYMICAEEPTKSTEKLAEQMNITTENVKELEMVCSLDQLNMPGMDSTKDRWSCLDKIPPDLNLTSVNFQAQEVKKRKESKYYDLSVQRKMKYRKVDQQTLAYHSTVLASKIKPVPEECQVIYPDVVLHVQVYRGMKSHTRSQNDEASNRNEQLIPSTTLLVLGRQKLTDLRDVIRCVHDLTVAGDASENPDAECHSYAKDLFKSGFFFINNTFYNDMRENDCRDYSRVIRDWASEKGRQMGPYESKNMEDMTFLDLTLQLGLPYLYMHQGDCEHLIIFSDIRLLTKEQPQDVRDYPYLLRKFRRQKTSCRLCTKQAARWITYGSEFAPENPCFYCDVCFRALHYDQDNKKMGQFQAYRFFDHHAIV